MAQSLSKTARAAVLSVPATVLALDEVYFGTVVALNGVGKETAASSDGFLFTDVKMSRECVALL